MRGGVAAWKRAHGLVDLERVDASGVLEMRCEACGVVVVRALASVAEVAPGALLRCATHARPS